MKIEDRFISYTKIDTTSHDSDITPSNPNEFILAKQLVDELTQLGVKDAQMDEHGFVYGTVEATCDKPTDFIGFLAHMDTSNATSGANIKARIISNYDGKDIELSEGIYSCVKDYPEMANFKGKNLIVTDGTTLLGGDDKAGIAILMTTIEYFKEHPEIPHGKFMVCFTPDEETGLGIKKIDLTKFPVQYAYTVDGGSPAGMVYECFNGAAAHIIYHGNSVHPGSAKGKMINAIQVAMDFHNMLPSFPRPENTDNYEGYNHILDLDGTCQQAQANYILRNHDLKLLRKQEDDFRNAADYLNHAYGKEVVELHLEETYYNMKETFADHMEIIDQAKEAIRDCGLEPAGEAARGGTDGSHLSFIGVPTPNVGTGGYNCHGNHEFVCIEEMETMVKIVTAIITKAFQRGK